jgi:hypothetical protein
MEVSKDDHIFAQLLGMHFPQPGNIQRPRPDCRQAAEENRRDRD